jgi:hypothetical protein
MEFPRFDGRVVAGVEVSGASAGQDLDCAVAAAALWPIGKRHRQDFVPGVQFEPRDASVSVPQSGRWRGESTFGSAHASFR